MTDRYYHRANFSTATTPVAGGRIKDPYGHEYASIPLQLPSNLVDAQRKPKKVEMLLTKLSIPLGGLPIATIPLDLIRRQEHPETHMKSVHIQTKGLCTIWPFNVRPNGTIIGDYNGFMQDTSQFLMGGWYISRMQYPLQNFYTGSGQIAQRLRAVEMSKQVQFFNIEDLMEFLSEAVNETYQIIEGIDQGGADLRLQFSEEDSKLVLHARNVGMMDPVHFPFTNQLIDSWGESYYTATGRAVTVRKNAQGVITGQNTPFRAQYKLFSLVFNRYVRDMFPGLPWREINNKELPQSYVTDVGTIMGQSIPFWEDENWDDPYFYVLDTMTGDSKFVDNGTMFPSDDAPVGDILYLTGVDYTFDGYNLVDIVPIQSFVVMLNGVSLIQQTHPINITSANASSALTTQIPVVEVYYPMWDTLSDMSTNLVISKDAFSNAAPIVMDEHAMHERNISFTIHYITKSGEMKEVVLPPGGNLSLQICYCVYY